MWRFLRRISAAVGRGLLVALASIALLLWRNFSSLFTNVITGIGEGIRNFLRRLAPWVIGALAGWYILANHPELFNNVLVLVIMFGGLYLLLKAARKKKKR